LILHAAPVRDECLRVTGPVEGQKRRHLVAAAEQERRAVPGLQVRGLPGGNPAVLGIPEQGRAVPARMVQAMPGPLL
jgi:hypothetical protein